MKSKWFPSSALDWLAPATPARVLDVSSSAGLVNLLADRGLSAYWAQPNPRPKNVPGVITVAAKADALPYDPAQFDTVTCHQSLHRFTPDLALGQIARVLRPNGKLCVSYLVRDESVPWVRRLMKLVQRYDPQAMTDDYGASSVRFIHASRYFPDIEQRGFRVWQPIRQSAMVDLVLAQPLARKLDDDARTRLIGDVEDIYRNSSSHGDDLMLPFRLSCWRAQVSHDELTTPVARPEPGLRIQL